MLLPQAALPEPLPPAAEARCRERCGRSIIWRPPANTLILTRSEFVGYE